MAYPQKHKQATMEFFDKMQEKMQAEESKRRKLSKQSTSSQPELLFLQFKPKHAERSFTLKPQFISQQTTTKKTWKPPTQVHSIETETATNKDIKCTSSTPKFPKDINEINKLNMNENQNLNESIPQENIFNHSSRSDEQENNNRFIREKTEINDTNTENINENIPFDHLGACREQNETEKNQLILSSCTLNHYDDCKQSNLLSERSQELQVECPLNDSCNNISDQSLSDQENIATQQNPNLPKELDIPNSESANQCHCTSRIGFEDHNKEISYNEDIQLINSIDLILSENQQSQNSQSKSESEKYDKNTPQENQNSTAVVESQRTLNEISVKNSKVECGINKNDANVEIASSVLDTENTKENSIKLTTSSIERFGYNEIESNTFFKGKCNYKVKNKKYCGGSEPSQIYSTNDSASSLHNHNYLQQSNSMQTYPDSSSCFENIEKVNDALPKLSSENSIHMNSYEIVQKSINQVTMHPLHMTEEHVSRGEEKVKNLNVARSDEDHEQINTKEGGDGDTLKEKKSEEQKTVNISDNEINLDVLQEKNETENEEIEGVNKFTYASKHLSDVKLNKHVAADEGVEGNEQKPKAGSDLKDEEKNGFDDDYSCLMISNSQLMELERKYYGSPENVKSPDITITNQSTNCTNNKTNSVGVQTNIEIIGMSSNFSSKDSTPAPVPTAQWTKKFQDTQRQLRDTIQEVARLNAILLKIRKDLWPQRNATEANKF